MELFTDVLLDAILDSLRLLPFLFAAFFLLEALEHHSTAFSDWILRNLKRTGPLAGSILGCIPQCGFSVLAANLYAGGVLSPGTLLAVFLSTSDEAVLILLGHPGNGREILHLLLAKLIIAAAAGYAVDLFAGKKISSPKEISGLCTDCGCHSRHGILLPALNHTFRLFLYIFVFSSALNLVITLFGLNAISSFLLNGSIFQPFFAALIGFVPNCAASVFLTELYLGGALSFSSVVAGLCTNAGVGLVVLFRVNKNRKENFQITALLYCAAVISGVVLHLAGL